jgi:hypothetical protein
MRMDIDAEILRIGNRRGMCALFSPLSVFPLNLIVKRIVMYFSLQCTTAGLAVLPRQSWQTLCIRSPGAVSYA